MHHVAVAAEAGRPACPHVLLHHAQLSENAAERGLRAAAAAGHHEHDILVAVPGTLQSVGTAQLCTLVISLVIMQVHYQIWYSSYAQSIP